MANEAFSLKSASVRWAGWATVTYGRVGKLKTRVGKRNFFSALRAEFCPPLPETLPAPLGLGISCPILPCQCTLSFHGGGGSSYSDTPYSDISEWVMQWVRVRVRIRVRVWDRVTQLGIGLRLG